MKDLFQASVLDVIHTEGSVLTAMVRQALVLDQEVPLDRYDMYHSQYFHDHHMDPTCFAFYH